MQKIQIGDATVSNIFANYLPEQREILMTLRELILNTANKTDGVGQIEEALRWGQPSYLTTQSGSGSIIRIDAVRGQPQSIALYFICNTTLIDDFKQLYPKILRFEGNRAIILDVAQKLPLAELHHCISLALTYHRRRTTKKHKPT